MQPKNLTALSLLKATKRSVINANLTETRMRSGAELIKAIKANKDDFLSAVQEYMISNPQQLRELNRELHKRGLSQLNYEPIAKAIIEQDEEDEAIIASGEEVERPRYSTKDVESARALLKFSKSTNLRFLGTVSDPGGANTIPVTLEDGIINKANLLGGVHEWVTKRTIIDGDYEFPVMKNQGKFVFKTEAGTFVDQANPVFADATNGINTVKVSPKDFGALFEFSFRMLKKAPAGIIADIMEIAATSYSEGREEQILIGDGVGENATGLIPNATDLGLASGDILSAISSLKDQLMSDTGGKIPEDKLKMVFNSSILTRLENLRLTNSSIAAEINFQNRTVFNVPFKVTNKVPTAAGVTQIVMGDFSHYVWGESGSLEQMTDMVLASTTTQVLYYTLADGKPAYNNSFAKISITL